MRMTRVLFCVCFHVLFLLLLMLDWARSCQTVRSSVFSNLIGMFVDELDACIFMCIWIVVCVPNGLAFSFRLAHAKLFWHRRASRSTARIR